MEKNKQKRLISDEWKTNMSEGKPRYDVYSKYEDFIVGNLLSKEIAAILNCTTIVVNFASKSLRYCRGLVITPHGESPNMGRQPEKSRDKKFNLEEAVKKLNPEFDIALLTRVVTTKYCTQCKTTKDKSLMAKGHTKDGYCSLCLECKKKIIKKCVRKRKENDPNFIYVQRKRTGDCHYKNLEMNMLRNTKQRAKTKGFDFNLDISDIVLPELCPILGIPFIRNSYKKRTMYCHTIDRIDNSKGYIKGNVQIVTYLANVMKNAATPTELLAFANWVNNTFKTHSINESNKDQ